jgi:hypothetical protein
MKPRRALLMLAAALGVGLVLGWPRGPRDPVFDGKRLSRWLTEANRSSNSGMLTPDAIRAVRAVGTNAIPYLLSEFERGGPVWLENLKQGKFVGQRLHLCFEPTWVRRSKAVSGLAELGPDAASALPTLARYIDDPERGVDAAYIMNRTQDAGLPYVLKAMSSKNPTVIRHTVEYLYHRGKAAGPAIPLLIQLMDHSDKDVRARAIFVLGYLPCAAGSTVPALRRALSDTDTQVRRNAALVLAKFWKDAKPAVPDLLRLLDDPDASCALLASNALANIDPSALPRRKPWDPDYLIDEVARIDSSALPRSIP